MSRFIHIHVGGTWTRVDGLGRCSECGAMVESTWRYFPTPGTWTLAWCEPCVESKLKETS